MGTSARAQMTLIRLADLWGRRVAVDAHGRGDGARRILPARSRCAERRADGGRDRRARHRHGALVLEADGDRPDGDARALHLGPSRPRRQRSVCLGRRAGGGVRNRPAPRTPSLQPPLAGDAHAQSRLSVRHAVHGHRQSLRSEHDRVVPCVAADLRRTRRRVVGRARRLRAAGVSTSWSGRRWSIAVGTFVHGVCCSTPAATSGRCTRHGRSPCTRTSPAP